MDTNAGTHRAINAVWRLESARIVAALARLTRDIALAEEMAQDALVAALEHWPAEGVPENPGAWLMATAKHRALDRLRQQRKAERKHDELGADLAVQEALWVPDTLQLLVQHEEKAGIADDLLRLIFTACHPVLTRDAQVALTLRLLGGLTTAEIARAFLTPEPTIAQRIVRAKRSLTAAQVPFEVPAGEQLAPRLAAVLEVIYLIFNEGYAATQGDDWTRPQLCDEALRLVRMLAEVAPQFSEAAGLAALLEIQSSRLKARVDPQGRPVLLLDQERTRWDHLLIHRGLAALARAETLAREQGSALGPYALQASIAACHARAARATDTDWPRICALYDALFEIQPSPIVALNRAVAVSMAYGPAAALPLVEALAEDSQLAGYHLLPSVQGDLLARLGRTTEARTQIERAAALATNQRERELLLQRVQRLSSQSQP